MRKNKYKTCEECRDLVSNLEAATIMIVDLMKVNSVLTKRLKVKNESRKKHKKV